MPTSKATLPPRPAASETYSDDRPTLVPAFDPEAFARDSEIKQRAAFVAGGEPTIEKARRLQVEGEYEQALFLLEGLLDLAPLHPEAARLSSECRESLERDCLSCVGSASAVLVAMLSPEELESFALDRVSSVLISLVNGADSVETILLASGLPRLLALRHLRRLTERGLVVAAFVEDPPLADPKDAHSWGDASPHP
jgi:hypothetical protein